MNCIVRDIVARTCPMFTGILKSFCKAGINYKKLMGRHSEFIVSPPCVERTEAELAEHSTSPVFCECRRNPTDEEVSDEMLRKADLTNRLEAKILAGRKMGLYQVPTQNLSSRAKPLQHEG